MQKLSETGAAVLIPAELHSKQVYFGNWQRRAARRIGVGWWMQQNPRSIAHLIQMYSVHLERQESHQP